MAADKEKITIKTESKTTIRGYGIELNDEKLSRIDQMVESYEKRVAARLDEEYVSHTRRSDRVADKVAAFGGSWTFIIIFASFLVIWIVINSLAFLGMQFDPKPFILLNLILSFIAAFQAPIIMMSQNRQAAVDRMRAENDYQVNVKAELEVLQIHEKLDLLRTREWALLVEQQNRQIEMLQQLLQQAAGAAPRPAQP